MDILIIPLDEIVTDFPHLSYGGSLFCAVEPWKVHKCAPTQHIFYQFPQNGQHVSVL
jgi:hypothetical protein